MRGKTLLVLAGLLGAGLLGYRYLPPHLNPLAPLALDDPPGWLTSFKLRRLTADQCASLLAEANRRRLIASQPVADSEGSCPLHNVVRVANFGSVTLSSSFLASCPLALSSALYVEQQAKPLTNGVYYPNVGSHLWVIALHGYRGSHTGATNLAQHYYDAGYQVLTPDLRACGDSEGNYVGMGWLDRKDVLQWIDWVLAQDSEAEIVLHGVSMGAATTMMTAGEDTPEQVKVFVEDCGYTSVWDIFSSELKLRFGLPEFPILYTASATARAKAGYGFKEASALQQVQNCEKPMLFIHGTADDFIPYEMMGTLYNAKPGTNKATLTAEGAGHGEAMDVLGDTYWNTVFDFEGQYMAG